MKFVTRGHGDKTTYLIDGKSVSKEEFDATHEQVKAALPLASLKQSGADSLIGWKPLHSEAMAVHPDLIGEAVADAQAKGVPTAFDAEGRPVFTSRSHRAEYCRRYGFFDRDGGYSDAQRGQSDVKNRDTGTSPGYDDDVPRNEQHKEVLLTDQQKREMDQRIERHIKGR